MNIGVFDKVHLWKNSTLSRKTFPSIALTPEQAKVIRTLTLQIEEVDDTVKDLAVEDVLVTLRNGHPLNRIITTSEGKIEGYIACEDFIPHEAYIKYLSTNKATGCNLLVRFLPLLIMLEMKATHGSISMYGISVSIVFLSAMDFIAYASTPSMGFQLITLKKS